MIYAINKRTKEHRICCPEHSDPMLQPAIVVNADERTVEADADGWIKHDGGECPLPEEAVCDVLHRSGFASNNRPAEGWDWSRGYEEDDIIAYRPILEADTKPEPPAWDGEGLPPVGCECEYRKNPDEWLRGIVFGHRQTRNGTTEVFVDFGSNWDYSSDMWRFRPIPSAEDKAVEEMAKIIMDVPEDRDGRQDSTNIARALYRAGYRKTGDKS